MDKSELPQFIEFHQFRELFDVTKDLYKIIKELNQIVDSNKRELDLRIANHDRRLNLLEDQNND